jgi:hypothetical protein
MSEQGEASIDHDGHDNMMLKILNTYSPSFILIHINATTTARTAVTLDGHTLSHTRGQVNKKLISYREVRKE